MILKLDEGDRVVHRGAEIQRAGTVLAATKTSVRVEWDNGDYADYAPADLIRAKYVRTVGGTVVHLQACHMARRGRAMPWLWAEDAPLEMVRRAVVQYGYKTCRVCTPLPDGRGRRFHAALTKAMER